MKVLYWNGGRPELEKVIQLAQGLEPNIFVINDVLNNVDLTPKEDRLFFSFAEDHFAKMYFSCPPDLRSGDLNSWLETIALEQMDAEMYEKYKGIIKAQEKSSAEHYEFVRDLLGNLPENVHTFVVPGRHDTVSLWNALGQYALHIDALEAEGNTLLGIGAIYDHSPLVARALRIGAAGSEGAYVSPEKLMNKCSDAEIFIINDFIETYYDRRLNTVGRANLLADAVNSFVNIDWVQDAVLKDKHKLVITPAQSNSPNSEVNHVHGCVILNAGKNVAAGYRPYMIGFGKKGVSEVTALQGSRGRRSTTYSIETILTFKPITEEDINSAYEMQVRELEKKIAETREKADAEIGELNEHLATLQEHNNELSEKAEELAELKEHLSMPAEKRYEVFEEIVDNVLGVEISPEVIIKNLRRSLNENEELLYDSKQDYASLESQVKELQGALSQKARDVSDYEGIIRNYRKLSARFKQQALTINAERQEFVDEFTKVMRSQEEFAEKLMETAYDIAKKDRRAAIKLYHLAFELTPNEERKRVAAYNRAVLTGQIAEKAKQPVGYVTALEWLEQAGDIKRTEILKQECSKHLRNAS